MNEYIKGNLVGITQTIIGFPMDTIKIYSQVQKKINTRFIFNGVKYPLFSNVISNTIFFGNCEKIKQDYTYGIKIGFLSSILINPFEVLKINSQLQNENSKISLWRGLPLTMIREMIAVPIYFQSYVFFKEERNFSVIVSGGLAGISSWLFVFPIDNYKSCIQSNSSFYFKNMFKGMGITLIRAFLVNSAGFWIYEKNW